MQDIDWNVFLKFSVMFLYMALSEGSVLLKGIGVLG